MTIDRVSAEPDVRIQEEIEKEAEEAVFEAPKPRSENEADGQDDKEATPEDEAPLEEVAIVESIEDPAEAADYLLDLEAQGYDQAQSLEIVSQLEPEVQDAIRGEIVTQAGGGTNYFDLVRTGQPYSALEDAAFGGFSSDLPTSEMDGLRQMTPDIAQDMWDEAFGDPNSAGDGIMAGRYTDPVFGGAKSGLNYSVMDAVDNGDGTYTMNLSYSVSFGPRGAEEGTLTRVVPAPETRGLTAYEGLRELDPYEGIATLSLLAPESAAPLVTQWAEDDPDGLAAATAELPDEQAVSLLQLVNPVVATGVLYEIGRGDLAATYSLDLNIAERNLVTDEFLALAEADTDVSNATRMVQEFVTEQSIAYQAFPDFQGGVSTGAPVTVENRAPLPEVIQGFLNGSTGDPRPNPDEVLAALNGDALLLTVQEQDVLIDLLGPVLDQSLAGGQYQTQDFRIANEMAIQNLSVVNFGDSLDLDSLVTSDVAMIMENYADIYAATINELQTSGEFDFGSRGFETLSPEEVKILGDKINTSFTQKWNDFAAETPDVPQFSATIEMDFLERGTMAQAGITSNTVTFNQGHAFTGFDVTDLLSHELFHVVQSAARNQFPSSDFARFTSVSTAALTTSRLDGNNTQATDGQYRYRHNEVQAHHIEFMVFDRLKDNYGFNVGMIRNPIKGTQLTNPIPVPPAVYLGNLAAPNVTDPVAEDLRPMLGQVQQFFGNPDNKAGLGAEAVQKFDTTAAKYAGMTQLTNADASDLLVDFAAWTGEYMQAGLQDFVSNLRNTSPNTYAYVVSAVAKDKVAFRGFTNASVEVMGLNGDPSGNAEKFVKFELMKQIYNFRNGSVKAPELARFKLVNYDNALSMSSFLFTNIGQMRRDGQTVDNALTDQLKRWARDPNSSFQQVKAELLNAFESDLTRNSLGNFFALIETGNTGVPGAVPGEEMQAARRDLDDVVSLAGSEFNDEPLPDWVEVPQEDLGRIEYSYQYVETALDGAWDDILADPATPETIKAQMGAVSDPSIADVLDTFDKHTGVPVIEDAVAQLRADPFFRSSLAALEANDWGYDLMNPVQVETIQTPDGPQTRATEYAQTEDGTPYLKSVMVTNEAGVPVQEQTFSGPDLQATQVDYVYDAQGLLVSSTETEFDTTDGVSKAAYQTVFRGDGSISMAGSVQDGKWHGAVAEMNADGSLKSVDLYYGPDTANGVKLDVGYTPDGGFVGIDFESMDQNDLERFHQLVDGMSGVGQRDLVMNDPRYAPLIETLDIARQFGADYSDFATVNLSDQSTYGLKADAFENLLEAALELDPDTVNHSRIEATLATLRKAGSSGIVGIQDFFKTMVGVVGGDVGDFLDLSARVVKFGVNLTRGTSGRNVTTPKMRAPIRGVPVAGLGKFMGGFGVMLSVVSLADTIPALKDAFNDPTVSRADRAALVFQAMGGGPGGAISALLSVREKGGGVGLQIRAFFSGMLGFYDPSSPRGVIGFIQDSDARQANTAIMQQIDHPDFNYDDQVAYHTERLQEMGWDDSNADFGGDGGQWNAAHGTPDIKEMAEYLAHQDFYEWFAGVHDPDNGEFFAPIEGQSVQSRPYDSPGVEDSILIPQWLPGFEPNLALAEGHSGPITDPSQIMVTGIINDPELDSDSPGLDAITEGYTDAIVAGRPTVTEETDEDGDGVHEDFGWDNFAMG